MIINTTSDTTYTNLDRYQDGRTYTGRKEDTVIDDQWRDATPKEGAIFGESVNRPRTTQVVPNDEQNNYYPKEEND